MMFKTALVTVVLTLVGSASAAPYVRPQAKLAQRDVQVLGVRHVQVPEVIALRGEHYKDIERRVIPEEVPTKADNGVVTSYPKREIIPAQVAVRSDANGNMIPYEKRDEDEHSLAKRIIDESIAVKSNANGDVSLYGKRVEDEDSLAKRIIDASIAVKTDANNNVVPYGKRDEDDSYPIKRDIPAEVAVKTDSTGKIVVY
jgi:hypothetical protein